MLGRVAAALLGAVALAGCSLGGDEEPKPISGEPKEIAAAIQELERATRARDWASICTDLFSAAARRRAGGRDCSRLLAETGRDVRRPSITPLSIELSGDRARVKVRTRARGQASLEDTVVLVLERGEWRIESLAG